MWKMTGWLAKTIAAGLLISFLSIWTTGYIVNSYVETLLKQFNVPLEQKPFALNGVWGGLWGADPVVKQKGNSAESDPKDKDADVKTGSGDGQTSSTKDDTKTDGDSPASVDAFEQTPSGELSDIGGGTGTKAGSGAVSSTDDEVAMTTEEINAAKSQISDADKEKLFNTMMTKLPQDAWQNISNLMEEGLTDAELTQVQQLMAQYLDRTEYDAMLAILSKY
ncbi:hypothetical protein [Paenibacillus sp. BC26]|uniref:hypothetical protein n=1 Tax=Paenibacillus sp. BC26 TaxID=1881032 RepID=UPI0008E27D50|nr:hypothetical protein [Paenibacillus sp. BC26]SFT23546.1 hypothetical protein SAMN05428962_5490 [Paenibacillus sp. BC26]